MEMQRRSRNSRKTISRATRRRSIPCLAGSCPLPLLLCDEMFAGYDPSAHVNDDFFSNKIAFVVLLNFPLTTLQERLREGPNWTRRQWAEVRLAERFSKRIPSSVNLELARAASEADSYIAQYNIWMHHVLDQNGQRLFAPKL